MHWHATSVMRASSCPPLPYGVATVEQPPPLPDQTRPHCPFKPTASTFASLSHVFLYIFPPSTKWPSSQTETLQCTHIHLFHNLLTLYPFHVAYPPQCIPLSLPYHPSSIPYFPLLLYLLPLSLPLFLFSYIFPSMSLSDDRFLSLHVFSVSLLKLLNNKYRESRSFLPMLHVGCKKINGY